jgi:hypothetical protein
MGEKGDSRMYVDIDVNREHLSALLLGSTAAVSETTRWRLPALQRPFSSFRVSYGE